ncbi:hypothetical protein [Sphaerospermopsis sp. LEGE 08334]|uniref:hypothetical protein n=1 Tax=Sphaerospermopsis sp. LEGE 08334 TaxID=1828651 RepID=UPI001880B752|nr:hypothetical protein [Sphaerospermopsis sp. LEGE 08334]MBE9056342.1 hypothetical protein [Sphaerospermopsis sp. LEGE 08334]
MINFRHLDDDEVFRVQKLSRQVEDKTEQYINSVNSSPFDIQDISLDFDELKDAVRALEDYFKELDETEDKEAEFGL